MRPASESFGSVVVTSTDTGSDHRGDRGKPTVVGLRVAQHSGRPRRRQVRYTCPTRKPGVEKVSPGRTTPRWVALMA
jgi:hypothetical protein